MHIVARNAHTSSRIRKYASVHSKMRPCGAHLGSLVGDQPEAIALVEADGLINRDRLDPGPPRRKADSELLVEGFGGKIGAYPPSHPGRRPPGPDERGPVLPGSETAVLSC